MTLNCVYFAALNSVKIMNYLIFQMLEQMYFSQINLMFKTGLTLALGLKKKNLIK